MWFLVGAVLSIVLVAAAIWLATGIGLFRLFSGSRDSRIVIQADQPTVVRQIQQLQRLETVRYTMDKIISGEHQNAFLPKFLAGDRLLLIVHGEVIGGVDLATLPPPNAWPPASTTPKLASPPATPASSPPRIPISNPKFAKRPRNSSAPPP